MLVWWRISTKTKEPNTFHQRLQLPFFLASMASVMGLAAVICNWFHLCSAIHCLNRHSKCFTLNLWFICTTFTSVATVGRLVADWLKCGCQSVATSKCLSQGHNNRFEPTTFWILGNLLYHLNAVKIWQGLFNTRSRHLYLGCFPSGVWRPRETVIDFPTAALMDRQYSDLTPVLAWGLAL